MTVKLLGVLLGVHYITFFLFDYFPLNIEVGCDSVMTSQERLIPGADTDTVTNTDPDTEPWYWLSSSCQIRRHRSNS